MGWANKSLFKWSWSHDMPIYGKIFKIFFFRTEWPKSLKLGIHHLALEYDKVCSNDDHRFIFDLFTQRSNLAPYAFA